ncbi:collagen alpha-1(II) chain-like [Centruroides sculpturatus]|uniref:collagen alpha-1(II) chain-like n=1 Tax=Centruroides sculpturatus TaxID=218467 RepID=UPI000C6E42CD|nr:collagen alpha-1(II) chain-like [Centruroides sculpturatus]
MPSLMSYFVLSIILGICSLYKAENFEDAQKAQPAYYTPDETSARDYRNRDGSEENALPDYYRNNFDCSVHRYSYGMYADLDFQCQVYHVCHNNRKESFLCPRGTLFNQQILSCDHWYSVKCQDSPNFYNVNELLGKSSNNTYNGLGGPYSTRRFPARPSYGQQGYGSLHSQNQLTPFSERDQANNTRYGSDQRGIVGEQDRYGPSTGYGTQSEFDRPRQYGDSQIGSSRPTGSQDSLWNRQQTQSPFDKQPLPTGSQSSLYNRRQPQPGFRGSSFDTQKPLAGVKGPLTDRPRTRPGSLKPEYSYGRQFPSTGSQRYPFSQPQPGDRFSSGGRPSVTGSRDSRFDKPELRPGSYESSFDNIQPGSERYPDGRRPFTTGSTQYPDGRQPFSTGSTRSPFGRPESGSFVTTKPETSRYPYGRQPSSHTTLGPSYDRSKIGSERYPSGRHTSQPGSRGSVFGRPDVRPASPGSSLDGTQPGSGRYPYGRQPFEQPDRTHPGSDQYSSGRESPEIGKPYGRPGSQQPPFDNRLTGRRYPYTTQRPAIGSGGYDVQKPVGFGGLPGRVNMGRPNQFSTYPRGPGSLNYNEPSDFQNTRFNQQPRGFSGSRSNNLQSSNYGRGSQPSSYPRSNIWASPSWRYNEFSSQTSSEWATESPLVNTPRDDLQTAYRPPDRLSNNNYTATFGNHQKSSELNVKDRSMLGQPSQQGESSLPSSDEKGLKPILVYENHVPVAITKNSTGNGNAAKETVNEEVPAYKLYYVKEDQIKN